MKRYIVLDLEATCWKERQGKPANEIIEIGALMVNEEGEILSEFCRFVKPLKSPILSDFCKELTSITQSQVDGAVHFPEVLNEFQEWIGIGVHEYVLCSWGFYDANQFRMDCRLWNLDLKWIEPHISIKHQYTGVKGLSRNMGMKRALALENIPLDGTHHRGIDDARNIAKIFVRYLEEWRFPKDE
ncbi:MAG: exonuclease domain-containing protein [Chitinophagales bacterium]